MGVGLDRPQIVQRHNLDIGPPGLDDGPQHIAPDAPKAVDRDLHCHFLLSW
jgi:hypothetical protein